jgi:hypothetical protein
MKEPREYIEEIRKNVEKLQSQQKVTPTENALFGMIDGMAGLTLRLIEQVADLKRRLDAIENR